ELRPRGLRSGSTRESGGRSQGEDLLMPEERVELSWGCPRRILSPLRLPFRHSGQKFERRNICKKGSRGLGSPFSSWIVFLDPAAPPSPSPAPALVATRPHARTPVPHLRHAPHEALAHPL